MEANKAATTIVIREMDGENNASSTNEAVTTTTAAETIPAQRTLDCQEDVGELEVIILLSRSVLVIAPLASALYNRCAIGISLIYRRFGTGNINLLALVTLSLKVQNDRLRSI